MTIAQLVGAVILAAPVALCLYVLVPLLVRYWRLCSEWADLTAQVDAARADFDDVRAAERETLIERIAREEAPKLMVEVEAYLSEVRP